MNRLKKRCLQFSPKPKAETIPPEHDGRSTATPTALPDAWWSQALPLNQEQADAVSKYLRELHGSVRLRINAVMLGKNGVGKDCVTHRLYSNTFVIVHGFDRRCSEEFALHVNVEGKHVQFDVQHGSPHMDWRPDNRPPHVSDSYFIMRHCEVCLYVYDVNDRSSFEAVQRYYEMFLVERNLGRPRCFAECSPSCLPRPPYEGLKFVIANKIDCEEKDRQVSSEEGEAFSASIGGTFIPMSAKTGEGTYDNLLADMTRLVFLRRVHYMASHQQEQSPETKVAANLHADHHHNRMFWY